MKQRSDVDFDLQQQKSCLLGRLQWKWFCEFHDAESLPSEAHIRRRLLEIHRENPSYGAILKKLIGCRVTTVRKITDMEFGFDIPDLLDRLEEIPWSTARFLEIQGVPSPFQDCEGIFIYQEKLRNHGRVYVITFFEEENFPLVSRMELRACKTQPEPFLSLLTTSGYQHYTLGSILNDSDEIDPRIMSVPLDDVEPADYDYALLYPVGLIKPVVQELKAGSKYEILVYWNGSAFAMSDDYAVYLAYRALEIPEVAAVVMGDYPEDVYGKGQKGGQELLPSLGYQYCPSPGRDKDTRLGILYATSLYTSPDRRPAGVKTLLHSRT